jgi:hypothetical protein
MDRIAQEGETMNEIKYLIIGLLLVALLFGLAMLTYKVGF